VTHRSPLRRLRPRRPPTMPAGQPRFLCLLVYRRSRGELPEVVGMVELVGTLKQQSLGSIDELRAILGEFLRHGSDRL
jgi:hypothetical protein